MLSKQIQRARRHKRVRAKVKGTNEIPRLCVFRSGKHIYAQLIDDEKGRTIAAVSDRASKAQKTQKQKKGKTKLVSAKDVGSSIARIALEKKISRAVFDRGGYKYHGRVKAVADGAKEGGLKF